MFTVSHDYYGILGVSKNATFEEIRRQYRKLVREHHPDRFNGLRAKYQDKGDEDLLKVIDEKIREAGEKSKLLNEAFEVLSDPIKRKQYDGQVVEPSVSLPEISIYPTRIAFGSLLEGQEKSLAFTIENKGGPPATVNIDWEGDKPGWGELSIEPDAENVFPIKVTVKVDTTGISSGPKDEKILVDVDGQIHMVEVFLAVTSPVFAPATPRRTYPSPTPPTRGFTPPSTPRSKVVQAVLVGALVLIAIVWSTVNSANQQQRARSQQVWTTQTAVAQEQLMEAAVQAKATVQAVETEYVLALGREAQLLKADPAQLVALERIKGDVDGSLIYGDGFCHGTSVYEGEICMDNVWGEYSLTNKSKLLTLYYLGVGDKSRKQFKVQPGETKSVYLLEYSFKDEHVWIQNSPCIAVAAKDTRDTSEWRTSNVLLTSEICMSPGNILKDDRRLSSLIQLDFWKYEDNLFYLIRVDQGLNHFIGVNADVDAPPPGHSNWLLTRIDDVYRGWDDPIWSPPPGQEYSAFDRCDFGHRPCRFFPGKSYKAYTFRVPWDIFRPEKKCVELSVPYFNSERVCKDIGNSPPP